MNELTVNNVELQIKEWNGERVVTFDDVDKVHNRKKGTASRNFRKNRERLIDGKDYFNLKKANVEIDEKRRFEITKENIPSNRGMIFLTKSGYLMIVKSMNDNKAWEVQRQLVNAYFMLESIAEEKKEETKNEMAIVQPTDFSLEFKKFMEFETKKNEEFRETMLKGFSTMANLIVNQNKLIEQLLNGKIDCQPGIESVKQEPVVIIQNVEVDNNYREWKNKINSKERSEFFAPFFISPKTFPGIIDLPFSILRDAKPNGKAGSSACAVKEAGINACNRYRAQNRRFRYNKPKSESP